MWTLLGVTLQPPFGSGLWGFGGAAEGLVSKEWPCFGGAGHVTGPCMALGESCDAQQLHSQGVFLSSKWLSCHPKIVLFVLITKAYIKFSKRIKHDHWKRMHRTVTILKS